MKFCGSFVPWTIRVGAANANIYVFAVGAGPGHIITIMILWLRNLGASITEERVSNMNLDQTDKKILQLIQTDFPIVSRPYQLIAAKVGITEDELLSRLGRMQQKGVIRRLGGLFDSRKLGYTGTLCAMKVPLDDIPLVARVIDEYPGITHNYIRDHEYNMWFTLLAESEEKLKKVLEEIKTKTKINNILNLPSVNVFKVRVNFDIK